MSINLQQSLNRGVFVFDLIVAEHGAICNTHGTFIMSLPLSPPPAGHIPAELGLLTALEELRLLDNELTGESIPF